VGSCPPERRDEAAHLKKEVMEVEVEAHVACFIGRSNPSTMGVGVIEFRDSGGAWPRYHRCASAAATVVTDVGLILSTVKVALETAEQKYEENTRVKVYLQDVRAYRLLTGKWKSRKTLPVLAEIRALERRFAGVEYFLEDYPELRRLAREKWLTDSLVCASRGRPPLSFVPFSDSLKRTVPYRTLELIKLGTLMSPEEFYLALKTAQKWVERKTGYIVDSSTERELEKLAGKIMEEGENPPQEDEEEPEQGRIRPLYRRENLSYIA
jgi:hypothetical protein